jgi:large subunit ribosomal protein L3
VGVSKANTLSPPIGTEKGPAMMGIIGKKLGMTQIFDSEGNRIPITVVAAGPCYVTQVKTPEKDSYCAVQLGYEKVPEKKLARPQRGHLSKATGGGFFLKTLREFPLGPEEIQGLKPGQEITVSLFKAGDYVDVTGMSKGRGFTGVMKRHNFRGFPGSHGTHEYFRHAGSVGCRFPQHTIKGTRMAGRHGGTRTTVQNLKVMDVRASQNLLLIKGAIPGPPNGLVVVRKAVKKGA